MAKTDIYNHAERYQKWKEEVQQTGIIDGLNKDFSKVLIEYIFDMEHGRNVNRKSTKGPRKPATLNKLRQKDTQIFGWLQERGITALKNDKTSLNKLESVLHELFADMDSGKMKKKNGGTYENSRADYVACFKAFWHWWRLTRRKRGIDVRDVAEDLDRSDNLPVFVWLQKENGELDKYCKYFDEDGQLIIKFWYDSLVRVTEGISLRVENVYQKQNGEVWIEIPEDVSKTFGRKFNLVYSGDMLIDYIKKKELKPGDLLFEFAPGLFNKKMQKVAKQVFGDKKSEAGEYYKNITLYDLRHSGAIHFRQLFQKTGQSLDSLRHRGGWSQFKILTYYTRLIGLDGHIEKEKTLLSEDKSKLEKDMEAMKRVLKHLVVGEGAADDKEEVLTKLQKLLT